MKTIRFGAGALLLCCAFEGTYWLKQFFKGYYQGSYGTSDPEKLGEIFGKQDSKESNN